LFSQVHVYPVLYTLCLFPSLLMPLESRPPKGPGRHQQHRVVEERQGLNRQGHSSGCGQWVCRRREGKEFSLLKPPGHFCEEKSQNKKLGATDDSQPLVLLFS
jgi:hypothetical protein